MKQLLVNTPKGYQDIVYVSETGKYFDNSQVVWNEWIDGDMPSDITVGGMVRNGNSLVFDSELFAQSERAQAKYKEQRQLEYPPMTDYLDGIVKGDQAQVQAYIDACLAVKAKYPKPGA